MDLDGTPCGAFGSAANEPPPAVRNGDTNAAGDCDMPVAAVPLPMAAHVGTAVGTVAARGSGGSVDTASTASTEDCSGILARSSRSGSGAGEPGVRNWADECCRVRGDRGAGEVRHDDEADAEADEEADADADDDEE